MMRRRVQVWALALAALPVLARGAGPLPYAVVDTGQEACFDTRVQVTPPEREAPFYGQDAQYRRNPPACVSNKDGTVTDRASGLMWQQMPGRRMTWDEAVASVDAFNRGGPNGYADWRLPTIKELDSLFLFTGRALPPGAVSAAGGKPFLDAGLFGFRYGDVLKGEAPAEVVYWSATPTVSPLPPMLGGGRAAWGIDFAQGRLQAYGVDAPTSAAGMANGIGPALRQMARRGFVLYVRGNADYGRNRFADNGNGTVSDLATGLLWQKADSGRAMSWQEALKYAEQLSLHGVVRWRLPNAKELESIVDFSRSPDATQSAALDPVFEASGIMNEAGQLDYPGYWSGTTLVAAASEGDRDDLAAVVSFGRAIGFVAGASSGLRTSLRPCDVGGAGARRGDVKALDPAAPPKLAPGDALRGLNYVRCVRDIPAN